MLATVSASALNVRSLPNISGRVLGVLSEGSVVNVAGRHRELANNWVEIAFKASTGFVYGTYLESKGIAQKLSGVVTVALLNVRNQPSMGGIRLGTVRRGMVLSIHSLQGGWYEIEFNDGLGYVAQEFVETFAPGSGYLGEVTARELNVRSGPSLQAPVLGQVSAGNRLDVNAVIGTWGRVRFNGAQAYLHLNFVQRVEDAQATARIPVAADKDEAPLLTAAREEVSDDLEPLRRLTVIGSSTERKVARTWNSYGGLLERLCEDKGIDPACAVAVLCVESSGKGFEQNNDNRMIIRFENHKFWRYWGAKHPSKFREHFRYRSGQAWKDHEWRQSTANRWSSFHGSQAREWEVFQFAEGIDKDAARLSISMGAPQIMGFHHERIGYQSVEEMFDAFSRDIGVHINGLFDFFSDSMTSKLRALDFEGFAAGYNGSGQKEKYGALIKSHYEAFKKIGR